jgi:hypothetical protein
MLWEPPAVKSNNAQSVYEAHQATRSSISHLDVVVECLVQLVVDEGLAVNRVHGRLGEIVIGHRLHFPVTHNSSKRVPEEHSYGRTKTYFCALLSKTGPKDK